MLLRRNEAYSAEPFVPTGDTTGGPGRAAQGTHLSSSAGTHLDTQHNTHLKTTVLICSLRNQHNPHLALTAAATIHPDPPCLFPWCLLCFPSRSGKDRGLLQSTEVVCLQNAFQITQVQCVQLRAGMGNKEHNRNASPRGGNLSFQPHQNTGP